NPAASSSKRASIVNIARLALHDDPARGIARKTADVDRDLGSRDRAGREGEGLAAGLRSAGRGETEGLRGQADPGRRLRDKGVSGRGMGERRRAIGHEAYAHPGRAGGDADVDVPAPGYGNLLGVAHRFRSLVKKAARGESVAGYETRYGYGGKDADDGNDNDQLDR